MSARCTGEAVSWLRLERFHLGEIEGPERDAIAAHLAGCPACAACLASIRDDDAQTLPPLPVSEPPRRSVLSRLPVRAAAVVGALAAAAAVVLAVRGGGPPDRASRPGGSHVKGDAVAFSLVREDGETIVGADGVYRDGDRFKAIVTCTPGASASFDVAVYDTGDPSFPLEPARELACGNDVPLPGALRLTGSADETVCLVWREGAPVDRGLLAAGAPPGALCKRLRPAKTP